MSDVCGHICFVLFLVYLCTCGTENGSKDESTILFVILFVVLLSLCSLFALLFSSLTFLMHQYKTMNTQFSFIRIDMAQHSPLSNLHFYRCLPNRHFKRVLVYYEL